MPYQGEQGVDMMEDETEYDEPFHILFLKETEFVMDIMAQWMTLGELGRANTKHNYKGRDGDPPVKKSNIGICLDCTFSTIIRQTVTTIGATLIYHQSTWDTNFWPDRKFVWYLVVTEVNTALASRHFQNGGDIMPNLSFQGQLAMQCM